MSHEQFPTDDPAVVTVGLLYANGPMHVGHLRGYVTGDALARSLRRVGQETAFVCASDMHGTPVAVNAESEGRTPEEYAIEWHEENAATYPRFNVAFDNYGHTREETNWETTQQFVRTWEEGGHIVEKEIQVAWDPEVEQPLPDRYVEGTCPYCGAHARGDECDEGCGRHLEPGEIEDATSVITGNPAEYRTREHKFLRLSDFQKYLQSFLDRLEGTENARNQPREWVDGELEDLCITRDMDWGIPYPDDPEDRVLYVWVDAPIEYVSSTKDYSERVGADAFDWAEAWLPEGGEPTPDGVGLEAIEADGDGASTAPIDGGEIVHVIGKDIIQHHTVFWPAMLRGAGFAEPRAVVATGFVTLDGAGFSTSRNRAVWADEYLEAGFHPDPLRYHLTTGAALQGDVDFSWERFAERVNTELVGTLGNFWYRSLLFAHRNFDGTPADTAVPDEVADRIDEAIATAEDAVNDYSVREVGEAGMALARFGNEYIQREEPWQLVDDEPERAARVIRGCVQLAKASAVLLEPVMPEKAAALFDQLEEPESVHDVTLDAAREAPPGAFGEPAELFEGVEDETVEELNAALAERVAESGEGEDAADADETDAASADAAGSIADSAAAADVEPIEDGRISFEEFQDLDLRVGEIVTAEPIEGADDLLRLEVDIGLEVRQVVAGLAGLHAVEELPGTRVVLVANMEPATLFGVESNGMVLAAGEDADLLTTHGDSPLGTRVH